MPDEYDTRDPDDIALPILMDWEEGERWQQYLDELEAENEEWKARLFGEWEEDQRHDP